MGIALASAIAGATAPQPPSDLVPTLMRDDRVATCAKEAGKTARAYVEGAFDLRKVRLRTGERMTVAVATDSCLMLGQSTQIFIFERIPAGYRRVLGDVTLPDRADVREDGTVVLPTHETMETIFEATYVWNGNTYAFSGPRSHIYDVTLGKRKPYQVPVRFAHGTFGTTLSGSVALNFGEDYTFRARAGQRLTIDLSRYADRRPSVVLSYGEGEHVVADVFNTNRWSGALPHTGSYDLVVLGSDDTDVTRISGYTLRLGIH